MIRKILRGVAWTLVAAGVLFFAAWLILPTGPRERINFDDPYQEPRTSVKGDEYMVSTGNQWTSYTAEQVLRNGGNAFDAAAAALLVLNVTYGEAASFPGVSPLLIYDAQSQQVFGYNGAGTAPAAATIERFKAEGHDTVPGMDIWSQLLPASPDMVIALLQEYGTKSFSELSSYAITLAEEGFPVHQMMLNNMDLSFVERFGFNLLMPYNVEVYLGGQWWRPLYHKERFTRPDLAQTFREMKHAEEVAIEQGAGRKEALQSVRDYFYQGPIAEDIVAFHQEEGGLFTKEDMENYSGYWEKPLQGEFNGYTVYTNQTWTQGAVVPLTLKMLETIDLDSLGHNSPEYIHTVIQAIELAMADREAYFGDPLFADVPTEQLLSESFAQQRRSSMTLDRAFAEMPNPGAITGYADNSASITIGNDSNKGFQDTKRDTSYIAIVDKSGNAVSLTPSDFPKSPMVPETGLTLGIRMTQFRLDELHPAALEPGKRPRISPNPGMILKDGKLFLTYGTPGGDMQTQAMVQMVLNMLIWDMDIQEAIDAPRFRSYNFPDSFSPHEYRPGTIALEQPLYDLHGEAMEAYGYKVEQRDAWDFHFGALCGVLVDPQTGELTGGADPREESWAVGR
ncbi:MAG: gamma-glutamyltransferase family protein [Spirochaetota bacterium]